MSDEQSTEADQVADLAAPRSAGAEASQLLNLYQLFQNKADAAWAERCLAWWPWKVRYHIGRMEAFQYAADWADKSLRNVLAGASSVGTDEAEAG